MSRGEEEDPLAEEEEGVRLGRSRCLRVTKEAIHVKITDHDDLHWIPKSQIHEDSEVWRKGDIGELVVTEWIAEKKGFA